MTHPAAKSVYFFLPLVAAVAIDLAPAAFAEPAQRSGSRVTQSSRSTSTPVRSSASQSRSSASQSRSSTSRSSSSQSRGSASQSRGSTSRGSSGSSRSSFGSSGSSRSSSGSSLFGRSNTSSGSRSTTPQRSTTPRVTTSSGTRFVAPTTGSSSGSTRSGSTFGAPRTSSAGARTLDQPSTGGTNARPTTGTTPVGTGYVPRTGFPTPGTSGNTTYARRFNGGLDLDRPATAERGGTLGPQGMGSVTSAIEALRREDALTRDLRAPKAPGARFRASDRAAKQAEQGLQVSYEDRPTVSPSGPRSELPGDARETTYGSRRIATDRMETARTQNARQGAADLDLRTETARIQADRQRTARTQAARKLDARTKNARYDLAEEQGRVLSRRLANAELAEAVERDALALGYATGNAVSLATRSTLGVAGSRLAGTAFGGYDVNGSAFDGYGDGYGDDYGPAKGSKSSYGYGFGYGYGYGAPYGYWDAYGCYYSPYSSWWNFGFGYSSGWGWYVGLGNCSPFYKSYWYSPWWYNSPAYYYPTYVSHVYDSYYDDPDVTVHVYADGAVGETSSYSDGGDVYVDAGSIYDAGYQAGAASVPADGSYITTAGGGAPAAAAAPAPEPAPEQGGLNSVSLRYLELGDVAFTGGRYTDAVHFYTRAVEFQGDQGMLHLVLADALFATGDYHAAAASIRRALSQDPMLVQSPVDKHNFYSEPGDFDVQLAQLELYFEEHPTDPDARLVLGLNYLFGGRPLAAMELLEKGPNYAHGEVDMAAQLILDSARLHRWGTNPPAEANWK